MKVPQLSGFYTFLLNRPDAARGVAQLQGEEGGIMSLENLQEQGAQVAPPAQTAEEGGGLSNVSAPGAVSIVDPRDGIEYGTNKKDPYQIITQPVGLSIVIGGTNVRIVAVGAGPEAFEARCFKWEWLSSLARFQGRSFEDCQHDFMEFIAREVGTYMDNHGIAPEQILRIGLSVPGFSRRTNGDFLITTPNIDFVSFPITKEMKAALRDMAGLNVEYIDVDNDGGRARGGEEKHQKGLLRGIVGGLALIVGTGIGGEEMGHCILKKTGTNGKSEFVFMPLDALRHNGCINEKWQFIGSPKDHVFWENLCAAPWAAVNFVREFRDPGELKALVRVLTGQGLLKNIDEETLGSLEEHARKAKRMDGLDAVERNVLEMNELDLSRSIHWARETKDSLIRPLTDLIFMRPADIENLRQAYRELGQDNNLGVLDQAVATRERYLNDLGGGLAAIKRKYPGRRIVIVSGFGRMLGKDPYFRERIQGTAYQLSDSRFIGPRRNTPSKRQEALLERGKYSPEELQELSDVWFSEIEDDVEREAIGCAAIDDLLPVS